MGLRASCIFVLLAALAVLTVTGCATPPADTVASVEPPALIARDDIFGNPERANVRISPDGERISYLAPVDGVLNVWVGPADDPAAAKAVTNDIVRGIRRYFWAFTNQHILYLQDKGGNENFRLYSVDIASSETRDLTPYDGVRATVQEVSNLHPEEILVGINDRDARFHDIYRLNIATGEKTRMEVNKAYAGYSTDHNYNLRFAMKMESDGGMQITRKNDMGDWEDFQKIEMEDTMTTQPVGFNKAGDVVYMIDSRGRNTAALMALNIESGESEVIFEDPRADVSGAIIHPTEYTVQAVSSTYERQKWTVLDESIQGDLDYLATVADGEVGINSRSQDDSKWIVGYELSDKAYSYYLYGRDAGEAKFLFTNRPALENETLAAMHALVIKSRDGLDLISYLTLPVESDPDGDGRPAEAVPMVLFVHGGPWGRDNWGYHPYHQWLANRGYAVLSVNYRASTGLGKEFINAANHEWAGKMHDDLIDAIDWAIEQQVAIPDKIAIMGGSYGGYATLVGVTFTPDRFACGVDLVGPSNLITLLESFPAYWQPTIDMWTHRVGDHRTEEGRALLTERSPLTYADKISKPLLIGQGANDPRVTQIESDQIVQAMQEKNLPVTYVLYPDEGHGFRRPENNTSFNSIAEVFLGQCLGGRTEPIGDAFEGSSVQVPEGAEHVPGVAEALAAMAPAEEPAEEEATEG